MWDKADRSQTCQVAQGPSELQRENERLRLENARLEQQAQDVAKANAHAAESLALLEATLEATPDGILVTETKSNRYVSYNSRFREISGLPDDVLRSWDSDRVLAALLEQLKEPEAFRAEVMALRSQPERKGHGIAELKDGTAFEYYSNPRFVGDTVVGRLWTIRDLTERYNAQKKQEALMQQVAAVNEELTHFAYVVSHDLKAPLRGIKLLTEWLAADYADKLGDDAKEQLDLLQGRVERMHDLIEGVLQYSRVGRVEEDRVSIDLNALLPSIIDAIAPPEHICITVAGPLPTVEGEKTRITQVFQNLLTNAVKYMDKPQGQIEVACADGQNVWTFSVRDNGPGIEEKYFERIFRIFQTLAPKDTFESTGVGLTLVKKIVEFNGGRVWVESVVGQGSTFFFTLPKQSSAARPPIRTKTNRTGPNHDNPGQRLPQAQACRTKLPCKRERMMNEKC